MTRRTRCLNCSPPTLDCGFCSLDSELWYLACDSPYWAGGAVPRPAFPPRNLFKLGIDLRTSKVKRYLSQLTLIQFKIALSYKLESTQSNFSATWSPLGGVRVQGLGAVRTVRQTVLAAVDPTPGLSLASPGTSSSHHTGLGATGLLQQHHWSELPTWQLRGFGFALASIVTSDWYPPPSSTGLDRLCSDRGDIVSDLCFRGVECLRLSSCSLAMSCTSCTSFRRWLTEDSDMAEVVERRSRSSTRISWEDSLDSLLDTSQLAGKLLIIYTRIGLLSSPPS